MVFQPPAVTPALSNQFLAQFVTDTRRLGQTLCATSLGDTVLDLSAYLLPVGGQPGRLAVDYLQLHG